MNALKRRQRALRVEEERLERLAEQAQLQRRLELLRQRFELIKRRKGEANGAS